MNIEVENRVRLVREALEYSRPKFGAALGVSEGFIANIELHRNKTDKGADFYNLLCSTYNVNPNWLISGKGEMFNPVNDYAVSLQSRNDLSPKAKFLLTRFMSMTNEEQDEFVDLLKKLIAE